MTATFTLASSGSFDITGELARVHDVIVTNRGPGSIYVGDIPPDSIDFPNVMQAVTGDAYVTVPSAIADKIQQGMIITNAGTGVTDGTVINSVTRGGNTDYARLNLSAVCVGTDGGLSFTISAPAISSSNGHEIVAGQEWRSSASEEAFRNQAGRRLVADAAGATITLTKTRA